MRAGLFAVVALGCGGGGGGVPDAHSIDAMRLPMATYLGTIDGTTPTAVDAYAFNLSDRLSIRITDYANGCSFDKMNNAHKAMSRYLLIHLGAWPGSVGMFDVHGDIETRAEFYARDATCDGEMWTAVSGSITIAELDGDGVSGAFDLAFDDGSSLAGSFEAPICNGGTPDGMGGACLP